MPFSSKSGPVPAGRSTLRAAERLGQLKISFGIAPLAFLLAWLVVNWMGTIRAIVHTYNPLPIWDYWRVVQNFDKYKAFDFSVLWVQHNEHRIVFPEIVFAADMLLFHGRQLLPLIVSFICYFLVWVVLSAALRSNKALPPLVCGASILLSGAMIGWQGCVVVLGSAFLLQWTMLQLAVTLGLFLLVKTRHSKGFLYLAGAITCGIIATYSSGNGMLIWPVMILAALVIPLTRSRLLTLIVAAIASIALYFVGYHSPHDLNLLAMVRHPLYVLGFILSYLSMPFGAIGSSTLSLLIGGLNLILFFTTLFVVLRRQLFGADLPILLLGSYLFTLLTAVLTAAGRMNPADHQYIAAKAARYVSLPLVNWAVLLLALIWLSSRRRWEVFSSGNLIFIAPLILLVAFLKLSPWVHGNNAAVLNQQWATLSLESDLFIPSILRSQVFPDSGFIRQSLLTLKQNHLSIYWGPPDATWVGQQAKSEFPGSWTTSLQGEIAQIFPLPEGAAITGLQPHLKSFAKLILVDGRGKIVGLGEKFPIGIPAFFGPTPATNQQNWVGFLNTTYGSKEFSVYLVKNHHLIRTTNPIAIPNGAELSLP